MARFDDEADIELTGEVVGASQAAWQFMADTWSAPEWLPKSQTTWVRDPDTETSGTMFIKAWLARKNGWREI